MENNLSNINDPIVVIDRKVADFNIYIECDFTSNETTGIGVGNASIKWHNVELLNEKMVIQSYTDEEIILSNYVKLFPILGNILQLEGKVELAITSTNFSLFGKVNAAICGLSLANCSLRVSNSLFAFDGEFLGQVLTFILSWDKNLMIIGKTVKDKAINGSVFKDLSSVTKINDLKLTSGQTDLSFKLMELMSFKGHFEYTTTTIDVKGNAFIYLMEIELFKGKIEINTTGFTLNGDLNLFAPSAIIPFNVHVDGNLNNKGLYLAGSNSTGIIGLINLYTHVSINNGLPELKSEVTILGANYKCTSGLFSYNNNIAFCLSYKTPPVWFLGWMIVPEITYYVMVSSAGLYGPSFVKPGGWPAAANTIQLIDTPLTALEVNENELPTSKQSIGYFENLLNKANDASCELDDQKAQLTSLIYQAEFISETENSLPKRIINIHKTKGLIEIKDNIFSQLSHKETELTEVNELEFIKIANQTSIFAKSNGIILKTYSNNSVEDFYKIFR